MLSHPVLWIAILRTLVKFIEVEVHKEFALFVSQTCRHIRFLFLPMLKVLYFIIMWRNVSFADHIELHFGGNVLPQSMKFGDVDNDGVGNFVTLMLWFCMFFWYFSIMTQYYL